MKRKDNKFYPLVFAISGFLYSASAGMINYFINPKENPWANLCFVVPMVVFAIFTLLICNDKIKTIKPKDIYIPPIIFSILFFIGTYGLTFIYPEMFLRNTYWSILTIYAITAICIAIITIIPKIPRKRFIILSYLGVLILAGGGITGAIYICFVKVTVNIFYLDILLNIRENFIG